MRVELIVVPYDSGHRGARMGAGPEHLVRRALDRSAVRRLAVASLRAAPPDGAAAGYGTPVVGAALTAYDPAVDTRGSVAESALALGVALVAAADRVHGASRRGPRGER